jgi:hypothetical protein
MLKLRQIHLPARSRAAGGSYRWHTSSGDDELSPGTASAPPRVGRRIVSAALAAAALLATVFLSALSASASGIFVRSDTATQANEADLVTEGANHTLLYYWAIPGSKWQHTQVAGPGSTFSAPSIFVRSDTATQANEADIVAEGPNHTLLYYWAIPGSKWQHTQVAGPGSTFSAPSIFVRSDTATQANEADIVAEGPNHTLQYYFATPGSSWHNTQVSGPGSTYSAPSIFVRSDTATQPNEADIVAQGAANTLQYYFTTPGSSWHNTQVAPAGTTFSAPSIFVRSDTATQPNEADIVAQGAANTLQYYFATPGSLWHNTQVSGPSSTFSAPSIFVRSDTATQPNEADIVAEGASHTLQYSFATPGSLWQHTEVSGPGTTYSG